MGVSDFFRDIQYKFPVTFMFRLKGTVILRIWWQIVFILAYSTCVTIFHLFVPGFEMKFDQTLVRALGVVIGMLLVFRTNTAYDRYWEGRRVWGTMTQNIRTLTRCTWVCVKEDGNSKEILEKRSIINLLIAFAYATKNYLREEYDYDSDGVRELIKHVPKFCTPSSNVTLESQRQVNVEGVKTATSKRRHTMGMFDDAYDSKRKSDRNFSGMAHDYATPTNIPLELSYYIASYIVSISPKGRDLVDPSTLRIMNLALNSLVECLTGFERILRTPIPLAYSVHLNQSVWAYLLTLPFMLVNDLGWWTLPATTLSSFALLGILGIGFEIENPFGYDDNDLPLDDFCKVIHREIEMIVGYKVPVIDTWILSPTNYPFSPGSTENALELCTKSVEELRLKLILGARRRIS